MLGLQTNGFFQPLPLMSKVWKTTEGHNWRVMRSAFCGKSIRKRSTHHALGQSHLLLKSSAPCEAHRAPYSGVGFAIGLVFNCGSGPTTASTPTCYRYDY
jgi:hypothetical protein